MTPEQISEHNNAYKKALALVRKELLLEGQTDLPRPGWLVGLKLKRALKHFERVLQLNPENWNAMWLIGKIHQRFRDFGTALQWFERAYQINPSQQNVAREASLCAMEIGNSDVAISFAYRGTQITPSDSGLQTNLALAYLLAGRLGEAQTAINKALEGDPADKISQTIQKAIHHFVTKKLVPPTTAPALRKYWKMNQKS
jgi:tetratricopeptide (TPR) repeat protein